MNALAGSSWRAKRNSLCKTAGWSSTRPSASTVTAMVIPACAERRPVLHPASAVKGNPVSMTQGLATLEVIDEENLQQNALEVGDRLKQRLLELQDKHPLIGEVRGLGLMLGVELVTDPVAKQPATAAAANVLERCKERGLILGKGGLWGQTLRIKPPMCITKDDADFLVDCLDSVLAEQSVKST